MNNKPVLFYIHDPMCSWCWGFKPVLTSISNAISDKIEIKYILGGLAKDSEKEMPKTMQSQIKSNWHKIQETIPGIEFNYDFWGNCKPRRSTYPACRAVIAAKKQSNNKDIEMISAIQHTYYLKARNPSDYPVLYDLAEQINLDLQQFKYDIHSQETQNELFNQISFSRAIGADSFPSLYFLAENEYYPVVLDYNHAETIIDHIYSLM